MSSDNDRMESLVKAFKVQAPAPWDVNREFYKNFQQATRADLKNGLFSFVSKSTGSYEQFRIQGSPEQGPHQFIIVGRKKLDDHAGGADVEEAEFEMMEMVKTFCWRPDLPAEIQRIRVTGMQQSQQLEAPDCWIVVELEIELDI